MQRVLFVCAFAAAIAACSKTPEPQGGAPAPEAKPAPALTNGAGSHADKAGPARPDDVAWDAPAGWKAVESPSKMRKATYQIPRAEGDAEDAEMSVIQAGGTTEMNIQRWAGQFTQKSGEVKRTERKVGDLNVTVVEIHGTFAGSGMPGAPSGPPKEGYALLGAIVDTSTPTFFKMTGPEKTVAAAKPAFDKLVDSLRAK